jgi:plastocyanin/uncharacterized cupredoxin-like copper-binding protein
MIGPAAALALVAGACGGQQGQSGEPVELGGDQSPAQQQDDGGAPAAPKTRKVDPRKGGFEVGFGEFAITLEAQAIRPGPVTFEITNGGKLVHGFEMEVEGPEGDSSGPGSGEGFKVELNTFQPGDTLRPRYNLGAGVYKIECFVGDHSDRGMEILLDVRPGAPLVRQAVGGASGDTVAIQGFAFDPATLEVAAGTEVTWANEDPEAHTVTAEDDSFDSGAIDPGKTFSVTLEDGSVAYICAIHPTMKGTVTVT